MGAVLWGYGCSGERVDEGVRGEHVAGVELAVVGPNSCEAKCGAYAGACWCDDACTGYGDCCDDYEPYCVDAAPVEADPKSCESKCGGFSGACWCDSLCVGYGDCCDDYGPLCAGETPAPPPLDDDPTCATSCVGHCGTDLGACSCASDCATQGDCCQDFLAQCDVGNGSTVTAVTLDGQNPDYTAYALNGWTGQPDSTYQLSNQCGTFAITTKPTIEGQIVSAATVLSGFVPMGMDVTVDFAPSQDANACGAVEFIELAQHQQKGDDLFWQPVGAPLFAQASHLQYDAAGWALMGNNFPKQQVFDWRAQGITQAGTCSGGTCTGASMHRAPQGIGPHQYVSETCAVCTAGADLGHLYGCINWGYSIHPETADEQDMLWETYRLKPRLSDTSAAALGAHPAVELWNLEVPQAPIPELQDCATELPLCTEPQVSPTSCVQKCGQSAGDCWCDSLCTGYGDCCADYGTICQAAPAGDVEEGDDGFIGPPSPNVPDASPDDPNSEPTAPAAPDGPPDAPGEPTAAQYQTQCDELCDSAGADGCVVKRLYLSRLRSCSGSLYDWKWITLEHSSTLVEGLERVWCVQPELEIQKPGLVPGEEQLPPAANNSVDLALLGYTLMNTVTFDSCNNKNHGRSCDQEGIDLGMSVYATHTRGWCEDCDRYYHAACTCSCDAGGSKYDGSGFWTNGSHVCSDDTLIQQASFDTGVCNNTAATCGDATTRLTAPTPATSAWVNH